MRQVYLVCGPPCAGKTTWVQQHAQPGDIVLDFDSIAQELGSPRRHRHSDDYSYAAEDEMQRRIADVQRMTDGTAYVIRSLPEGRRRRHLAATLNAEIVLLLPSEAECVARVKRARRPPSTRKVIWSWYRRYTP